MTYDGTKSDAYAQSQVGFHEYGPNGNPWSKLQYGVEYPSGGWCCSFVSYCARMGEFDFDAEGSPRATYGAKGFSFTDALMQWAQAHGLWRDRWYKSKPGDLWIFNWDGRSPTDHVGENHYDNGSVAVLIEGNTSNQVAYRSRDRRYLTGIVALSASKQATPPVNWEVVAWIVRVTKHPLRRGDKRPIDNRMLNLLLVVTGHCPMPAHPEQYTLVTAGGVRGLKREHPELDDNADHFGGPAALALVASLKH